MVKNPLILTEGRLSIPVSLLKDIYWQSLLFVSSDENSTSYDAIGTYYSKYFREIFKEANPRLYRECKERRVGISAATFERAHKGKKGKKVSEIKYEFLDFLCFACFNKQSLSQVIHDQRYWQGEIQYSVEISNYAKEELSAFTTDIEATDKNTSEKGVDSIKSVEDDIALEKTDQTEDEPPKKSKARKLILIPILFTILLVVGLITYYSRTNRYTSRTSPVVTDTLTQKDSNSLASSRVANRTDTFVIRDTIKEVVKEPQIVYIPTYIKADQRVTTFKKPRPVKFNSSEKIEEVAPTPHEPQWAGEGERPKGKISFDGKVVPQKQKEGNLRLDAEPRNLSFGEEQNRK